MREAIDVKIGSRNMNDLSPSANALCLSKFSMKCVKIGCLYFKSSPKGLKCTFLELLQPHKLPLVGLAARKLFSAGVTINQPSTNQYFPPASEFKESHYTKYISLISVICWSLSLPETISLLRSVVANSCVCCLNCSTVSK